MQASDRSGVRWPGRRAGARSPGRLPPAMTRAQRGRGRRWDAHGSPGGRPCHVLYKPGSSCTASGAVRVVPLYEAEIVTVCVKRTTDVLTLNVTLTAPAGTVTLGGTEAAEGLLLDSATCAPPAGAGPFSVTAPEGF